MAMLESMAPDEPRRNAALPDLRQRPNGVAGDVGAVLVDDRHDAERHADPLDPQAVGAGPPVERPRRRDRPAPATWRRPVGHGRDPRVGEPQPVDHGGLAAVGLGGGDVVGVGGEDLGVAVDEQVGGREQRGVLRRGRRGGQDPAGRLGAAAELGDGVVGHPGSVGPGRPGSYRTID